MSKELIDALARLTEAVRANTLALTASRDDTFSGDFLADYAEERTLVMGSVRKVGDDLLLAVGEDFDPDAEDPNDPIPPPETDPRAEKLRETCTEMIKRLVKIDKDAVVRALDGVDVTRLSDCPDWALPELVNLLNEASEALAA